MINQPDSVKAGVAEAWDFWLSQHDISVPEIIKDAVRKSMSSWLDDHADDLFREAAAESTTDDRLSNSDTTPRPSPGWTPEDQPWIRRSNRSSRRRYLCYFCGQQSAIISSGDLDNDAGRLEIYCDSPDCEAREIAVIVMRDGCHASLRADVRVLQWIDEEPAKRKRYAFSGADFIRLPDPGAIVARRQDQAAVCLEVDGRVPTDEAMRQLGAVCACAQCIGGHAPEQRPADRPEWVDADVRLVATISAMTHARLGADLVDGHIAFPVSHCDIDRATRLLSMLDYHTPRTPAGVAPIQLKEPS